MKYRMHLDDFAFLQIKSGIKKYEIRLQDEKRAKIAKGDIILFHNSQYGESEVEVLDILKFESLVELLNSLNINDIGFSSEKDLVEIISNIYSQDKISKYGILAIHIKNQS